MKHYLFTFILAVWLGATANVAAQTDDEQPSINPSGESIDDEGKEETGQSFTGSAPKTVRFYANPQNVGGWNAYYEWRFYLTELNGTVHDTPYLIRYEEDTEYTFTQAGQHRVMCYAYFTQGTDTVFFTDEYWNEREPLSVTISESRLEMPNAFSPNDDDTNDYYNAKGLQQGNGPQSIVSFDGYIFNRWGQMLYHWTDCYTYKAGWDGTYKGKPVKQGVYFCLVKAKGADGRDYHIRTDVNLLRGYTEDTGVNSNE